MFTVELTVPFHGSITCVTIHVLHTAGTEERSLELYTLKAEDRSGWTTYSVLATRHRLLTVLTEAGVLFVTVITFTTCLCRVSILLNYSVTS